jgi:hypothetical protein
MYSDHEQAILQRLIATCERDDRVVAAFLGGSLASGKADEWSDVDVYVVTRDDAFDGFAAGLRAFVEDLGTPIFLEDFGLRQTVFFVFEDGTEGELGCGSESNLLDIHKGPYKVLLDKSGILGGVVFKGHQPTREEQVEALRRQIFGFWHDLSHFVTAMGRGQIWWARGQLEALRRSCVNLVRLQTSFADAEVGDEPYFKVEQVVPVGELAPLETTFNSVDAGSLLPSALQTVAFYRQLAPRLAAEHSLSYPSDLERVMLDRLERLGRQNEGSHLHQ